MGLTIFETDTLEMDNLELATKYYKHINSSAEHLAMHTYVLNSNYCICLTQESDSVWRKAY